MASSPLLNGAGPRRRASSYLALGDRMGAASGLAAADESEANALKELATMKQERDIAQLAASALKAKAEELRQERDAAQLLASSLKAQVEKLSLRGVLGSRGVALLKAAGVDVSGLDEEAASPSLAAGSEARLKSLVLNLSDQEHALNQAVAALTVERDELREGFERSQKQMALVASALKEAEEEMQRQLEAARKAEREAMAKAEAALTSEALYRQQLAAKEQELSEAKQTLEDTRAQRDARIAFLTSQLEAALERAQRAEEADKQSEKRVELARLDAQSQNAAVNAQLESVRSESLAALSEASRLRQENARLRHELEDEVKPALYRCQEALECERAISLSANKEVVVLREENSALGDKLIRRSELLKQAREEASDLETALAGAQREAADLRSRYEPLQAENQDLVAALASRDEEVEALHEELHSTEQALESAAARITHLQLQLQGLGDEADEGNDTDGGDDRSDGGVAVAAESPQAHTPAKATAATARGPEILRSPQHASSFAATAALTIEHLQLKIRELEAQLLHGSTAAVVADDDDDGKDEGSARRTTPAGAGPGGCRATTKLSKAAIDAATTAAAASASRFALISPPGSRQQYTQRPNRITADSYSRKMGGGASFGPVEETERDGDNSDEGWHPEQHEDSEGEGAAAFEPASRANGSKRPQRATKAADGSARRGGGAAGAEEMVDDDSHRTHSLLPWSPPESAHQPEAAAADLRCHQLQEEVESLTSALEAAQRELEAAAGKIRESGVEARLAKAENTRLTALVLRYKSTLAAAAVNATMLPQDEASSAPSSSSVASSSRLTLALSSIGASSSGGNDERAAGATALTFDASALAATASAAAEAVEDLLQAQAERRKVANEVETLCRRAQSLQLLIGLVNKSLEAGHSRAEATILALIAKVREVEDRHSSQGVGVSKAAEAVVAALMAQLSQLQSLQVAHVLPSSGDAQEPSSVDSRLQDAAAALKDEESSAGAAVPGLPPIRLLLASPILSPLPPSSRSSSNNNGLSARSATKTAARLGTDEIPAFSIDGSDEALSPPQPTQSAPLPPEIEAALLLQRDGALSLAKRAFVHVGTVASCAQALASVALRHKASAQEVEGLLHALSSTVAAAEGDSKRGMLDGESTPSSARAAISTLQAELLEALGREQRRLEAAGELTERQLLVSQLSERVAECHSLTAGAMQVAEKLSTVSAALNAALAGKAAAEKKIEELAKGLVHAQKAVEKITARAAAADAEARKKLAALEAQFSSADSAHQAQLRSLRTELAAVSEEKLAAQAAAKAAREDSLKTKQLAETQYQAFSDNVAAWRAVFAAAVPDGAALPADPQEASNMVAELKRTADFVRSAGADAAGSRQQLLQQHADLEKLRVEAGELRQELALAQTTLGSKDEEIAQLEAQKKDLEEQATALQVQVGALGDKISELVDVAKGLLERKTSLKMEIAELKDRLREAVTSSSSLSASKRTPGSPVTVSPLPRAPRPPSPASSSSSSASASSASSSPAARLLAPPVAKAKQPKGAVVSAEVGRIEKRASIASIPAPLVAAETPPSLAAAELPQAPPMETTPAPSPSPSSQGDAVALAVQRVLAMTSEEIVGEFQASLLFPEERRATAVPVFASSSPGSALSVSSSSPAAPAPAAASSQSQSNHQPSFSRPTISIKSFVTRAAIDAAASGTQVSPSVMETAAAAARAVAPAESSASSFSSSSPPAALLRAQSRRNLGDAAVSAPSPLPHRDQHSRPQSHSHTRPDHGRAGESAVGAEDELLQQLLERTSPDLTALTGLPAQAASGPASGPAATGTRRKVADAPNTAPVTTSASVLRGGEALRSKMIAAKRAGKAK